MRLQFLSGVSFLVGGHFYEIFHGIFENFKFLKKFDLGKAFFSSYSSTSPTDGNQVDGLPSA